MFDRSALVVGVTGAVLLAGTLVPVASDSRPEAATRVPASTADGTDSIAPTIGFGEPDGAILFRAEPMTSTTWIARNGEAPTVTARQAPVAPAVQPAAPARAADDPGARKSPKTRMVGCEGAVSPLVKQQARAMPGLCVT